MASPWLDDPQTLIGVLASGNFELQLESRRTVAAGKSLWMGVFGRAPRT